MSQWKYSEGRIYRDGQDIADLVGETTSLNASELSRLSAELKKLKQDFFWKFGKKKIKKTGGKTVTEIEDPTGRLGKMAALVDAYVAKISRLIGKKYRQRTDGVSLTLDAEGQLVLNGMNITAFLARAGEYPTDKAVIFLKGIKNRLEIALANTAGGREESLRNVCMKVFEDIERRIKDIKK